MRKLDMILEVLGDTKAIRSARARVDESFVLLTGAPVARPFPVYVLSVVKFEDMFPKRLHVVKLSRAIFPLAFVNAIGNGCLSR